MNLVLGVMTISVIVPDVTVIAFEPTDKVGNTLPVTVKFLFFRIIPSA